MKTVSPEIVRCTLLKYYAYAESEHFNGIFRTGWPMSSLSGHNGIGRDEDGILRH
jgi:hypothetical protein